MILLLPHNGMIVLSGRVSGAKRKNKTRPPSVQPLFPLPNTLGAIFVTPAADLNSDVAGANGMWVVWGFRGGGQRMQ